MSGSFRSIRRTASPINGWSSISKTVIRCSVNFGAALMGGPLCGDGIERGDATACPPSLGRGRGGGMGDDGVGDLREREDLGGGTDLGGGAGHAVDDAGRLVLGDGVPASAAEL